MMINATNANDEYDKNLQGEHMSDSVDMQQENIDQQQSPESIKDSIRALDSNTLTLEQGKVDAAVIAEENKLVFLGADWELFKVPANVNLYKNDPLQAEKKKLYETSLYLNNLKKLTSKLDQSLTIYESGNYKSLKGQGMDASKQAIVDGLKASLSLTGDKAINAINKINPVEWVRKANTKKVLNVIKKQWDEGKQRKAALTLVSSFTVFDGVLRFTQIGKIKNFLTSPGMKFSTEIHALMANVADQIQKHYRRNRIDADTLNQMGELITTMYTTLTGGHTEPSTLRAIAGLRA